MCSRMYDKETVIVLAETQREIGTMFSVINMKIGRKVTKIDFLWPSESKRG